MAKFTSTISFARINGGKERSNIGKKKVKKAAKYHLSEMKISKKKFKRMMDDFEGKSIKKALIKYRREHADQLSEILLSGRLKNPEKYEAKLQDYLQRGKLFNPTKRKDVRKVAKKNPSLFIFSHIISPYDPEMVTSVMGTRVKKLSTVVDEKAATKLAPLTLRSDLSKVLRSMIKIAVDKDSNNFSAKDFFDMVRPKMISKKDWKESIVITVLGMRGFSNNAMKDIIAYAIGLLGNMPKDRIKKLLKRYADSISKIAESGERLNFLVTLKDLTDDSKIEKVLNNNSKIASVIGQI